MLIIGGRNENDVDDLHCFDLQKMRWKEINVGNSKPQARRRLTCIQIGPNTIVMFGGFNGQYYNDLHALDFSRLQLIRGASCSSDNSQQTHQQLLPLNVRNSHYERDFLRMINSEQVSDCRLKLIRRHSDPEIFEG